MPLTEPSILIPFYVANSGEYILEILSEDGKKLNSLKVEALKGYNYVEYDVSTSEKSVKNYFAKKEVIVEKAQTEKYYLPKGVYTVKIGEVESAFELK